MCQQGGASSSLRDEAVQAAALANGVAGRKSVHGMEWCGLRLGFAGGAAFKCPDLPIRAGGITVRADGNG